ncbi:MAG: hypothetical protein KAI47_10765, partial [Deltaproteobacteria bacterium]|nr:hypothetical protein [Deltaproteobacteria bacterium]
SPTHLAHVRRQRPYLGLMGLMLLMSLMSLAACSFDGSGVGTSLDVGGHDVVQGDTATVDAQKEHDTLLPDGPVTDTRTPDIPAPDLGPCAGLGCAPSLGCNEAEGRCYLLLPITLSSGEFVKILDSLNLKPTATCDLSPPNATSYKVNSDQTTFAGCPDVATLVISRKNYPDMHVYAFDTLHIGQHATVRITGGKAVLLYARHTIDVAGRLDVGADKKKAGPGGKRGPSDEKNNGTCWFVGGQGKAGRDHDHDSSGGGGAAGDLDGAAGGASTNRNGGEPGLTQNAPTAIAPLFGGCSGGSGAGADGDGGLGGGGGGALHLAANDTITISGAINAGGGGGDGGHEGAAGGGGGGGGKIVLEAVQIVVTGKLTANGGAGGAGAAGDQNNANDGDNGLPSNKAAGGGA